MNVEVTPDRAHHAGHALIRVEGAASAVDAPKFRLHRPDWTECNLGPNGWQVAEALLEPDRAAVDGADLLLHAGPSVCAHTEAGTYEFTLPAAGVAGVAVAWPDIADIAPPRPVASSPTPPAPAPPQPASPGGAAVVGAEPPPPRQVQPAPLSPRPVTEPGREGHTVPPLSPRLAEAGPGGRSRWPVLAAVAAVLLAGAGGGWYAFHPRPEPDPGPVQAVAPAPAPPVAEAAPRPAPEAPAPPPASPPPPPLSLTDLSVPEAIARAPNVAAMAAEGERRLESDRKDDGLLLLEAAADRGDGRATAALARLYDPNGFRPGGPIPAPDARQAARYYRDAAHGGADGVAEPRAALRAMLERRAGNGDLAARLTLKDFWP